MIEVLILAAGQSARMGGQDKLLLPVEGVPLLRRLAVAALTLGGPVFIALPRADHPRAEALAGLDVVPLAVPEAAEGMSGTLRGAVARLPGRGDFMVVLGDLAALEAADLHAVLRARHLNPENLIWRGATASGKPGHPIIFAGELRPRFARLQGDGGGESLVAPLRAQTVLVPLQGDRARLDLDTPEDWARFRAETGR